MGCSSFRKMSGKNPGSPTAWDDSKHWGVLAGSLLWLIPGSRSILNRLARFAKICQGGPEIIHPGAIPQDAELYEHFGVSHSFCRGSTSTARTWGVMDKLVIWSIDGCLWKKASFICAWALLRYCHHGIEIVKYSKVLWETVGGAKETYMPPFGLDTSLAMIRLRASLGFRNFVGHNAGMQWR